MDVDNVIIKNEDNIPQVKLETNGIPPVENGLKSENSTISPIKDEEDKTNGTISSEASKNEDCESLNNTLDMSIPESIMLSDKSPEIGLFSRSIGSSDDLNKSFEKLERQRVSNLNRLLVEADSPNKSPNSKEGVFKLSNGWLKKVVQRKSGVSEGKYDVYIFSPEGVKFRSRVEVKNYLEKINSDLDISCLDFSKPDPPAKRKISLDHPAVPRIKQPKIERSANLKLLQDLDAAGAPKAESYIPQTYYSIIAKREAAKENGKDGVSTDNKEFRKRILSNFAQNVTKSRRLIAQPRQALKIVASSITHNNGEVVTNGDEEWESESSSEMSFYSASDQVEDDISMISDETEVEGRKTTTEEASTDLPITESKEETTMKKTAGDLSILESKEKRESPQNETSLPMYETKEEEPSFGESALEVLLHEGEEDELVESKAEEVKEESRNGGQTEIVEEVKKESMNEEGHMNIVEKVNVECMNEGQMKIVDEVMEESMNEGQMEVAEEVEEENINEGQMEIVEQVKEDSMNEGQMKIVEEVKEERMNES